jgi:NADH:ubiquinone oxidoreductase subunit 4 (subunit M)
MGAAQEENAIREPSFSEISVLSLLIVAMIVIGLYPTIITSVSSASVTELVNSLNANSR